jgi:hypothetical protein
MLEKLQCGSKSDEIKNLLNWRCRESLRLKLLAQSKWRREQMNNEQAVENKEVVA